MLSGALSDFFLFYLPHRRGAHAEESTEGGKGKAMRVVDAGFPPTPTSSPLRA